jgi:hypothetical protein
LKLNHYKTCNSKAAETEFFHNTYFLNLYFDSVFSAPSHRILPVKLYRNRDRISANFLATEIGEHIIDVKVRDQKVIGAPFR